VLVRPLQRKIQKKIILENWTEEYVIGLIPEATTVINNVISFVAQATELLSISYTEESTLIEIYLLE